MPGLEVTFQSTARFLACRTLWELPIAFLSDKVISKQLQYTRDACHTHNLSDPDRASDVGKKGGTLILSRLRRGCDNDDKGGETHRHWEHDFGIV